ncbi:MAG: FAD/NAD(P)-binding protein [Candidatus Heimdallarchaeaceae archaeon]
MNNNPYMPEPATITSIREETTGERPIKTFRMVLQNEDVRREFSFLPGQCVMVSNFGVGESLFAISSSPTQKDFIEVSVLRYGKNTKALHLADEGDSVGLRGPYGNSFDVKGWEGKNMLFIGGGIGQAPLRSVINYILGNRDKYKKIDIVYGARTTKDLCYKDQFAELKSRDDVSTSLSIDVFEEGWEEFVGFVPDNLMKLKPSPENTIAITCGPPIMIKYVLQNLEELGFKEDQIFTTLEMRMKCGIGICGRCNIGSTYVCVDGPVFSYRQLKTIEGDM